MSKINIFLKDIDVPEVVQKKADLTFLSIQTEGRRTMKKGYYKFMVSAAACAALVAAVWIANGIGNHSDSDLQVKENSEGKENSDNPVNSILSELDRMFTLRVQAAELESGHPVPIFPGSNSQGSHVLGVDDEEITYCINVPITCEGEGIESVTYSINKGAFQIVQPKNEDERIIVSGQLYGEEMNAGGWIGGDYDEENGGLPSRPYEAVLYKSFTLDYERQSDEYTWINICNACPYDEEIYDLIWGENATLEDDSNALNMLLNHTVITCTIHYADGMEQSADIQVGSQVMTKDIGDGKTAENIVITYELLN